MLSPSKRYLYLIFLVAHVLCLVGLFTTSMTWGNILLFVIGYSMWGGLGAAIGLHRWLSHKAIVLHKWAEPIVVWASIVCLQGQPMWWAAVHRGYHHRYSDKDGDQHSPVHGKWHAFNGWIHTTDHSKTSLRSVVDLGRIPMIAKTHKYYELIIYATWIIAGCISLDLLFWGFVIPAIVALHIDNAVNLFCHLPGAGYRNFETTDQSVNVPILGYLGWGQGWHNNHHAHASKFDFGRAVSGKKWEYDPCMLFVPFIAKEIR